MTGYDGASSVIGGASISDTLPRQSPAADNASYRGTGDVSPKAPTVEKEDMIRKPRCIATVRICLFAALAAISLAPRAFAQLNSNTVTITLNATLAESISVSATPTTVSFTLVAGGTATGNSAVAITTTWVLASSRANVVLDGYFATAAAALSGSASPVVNIPSSEVYGLMSTGSPTTYTAFTANTALGPTGAGLLLFTQALSSTNRNANRTDNLSLQINLSAQPQLPAASNYTGSLFLQAQAL